MTEPKNVIIKLKGGLGNQMFQYAFSQALKHSAEKTSTPIHISYDATAYTNAGRVTKDTLRTFDLQRLHCDAPVADADKLTKARNPFGIFSEMYRKLRNKLLQPDNVSYQASLLQPPFKSYYEGYWQSPQYFKEIQAEIRHAFTFREPLRSNAKAIMQSIDVEPNAVSVFYRKTDYINHNDLDVCDEDYYQRAFTKILELVPNAKFFVTSDDIEWVKQNAKLPEGHVLVSDKQNINYIEEMEIISHCKHFIIPNSTFAWWTAYLTPHYQTAHVIAPALWSKKHTNTHYKDITPSNWLRV